MDKSSKANVITFIFFMLFILTYIILPIVKWNVAYLIFTIIPFCFFISLIISLLTKYNKIKTSSVDKVSKGAAIASILFNGSKSSAIYNMTSDGGEREERIKNYPLINPIWLFCIAIATIFSNFAFFIVLGEEENLVSGNAILITSIISIAFIILAQISSTINLIKSKDKKAAKKEWKVILLVILVLIGIAIFSMYMNRI